MKSILTSLVILAGLTATSLAEEVYGRLKYNGVPQRNVTIKLVTAKGSFSTRSDSNGDYSIKLPREYKGSAVKLYAAGILVKTFTSSWKKKECNFSMKVVKN